MLKSREAKLLEKLKESLPQSSVADDLFEYLAIRLENVKTSLCKDLNAEGVGKVKELTELINVFSPKNPLDA